MALAFRRATTAAEEAYTKGYPKHFEMYGIRGEPALTFDWDSAKAMEGETTFNTNSELLPKSITAANIIKSNPNYLGGLVSLVASKAGKASEQFAFDIQARHITSVCMHFDDKGETKGQATWTCEVKDKVVHATMHINFDQYCGRYNWAQVAEFIVDYLDNTDNFFFQLERKKFDDDVTKGSTYLVSDGIKYLRESAPGKEWRLDLNYDEMAATEGRSIYYSNQPPKRNSWILLNSLNDGRLMLKVRGALGHLFKDAMGKAAFCETFDAVAVNVRAGTAHAGAVVKEGKTLVFNFTIKMEDHQNAARGIDATALGKAIENLL